MAAEAHRRADRRLARTPAVAPSSNVKPADEIVEKFRFSGFLPGTSELPDRLRARGFDTVLITGTVTNVCCESSARDAMMTNFKKRAEYEALRNRIDQVQQENDRYTQQIQGLKSDQKSVEKEAREQLGYAKPGEYVYVPPVPAKPAPPVIHSAKK